MSTTPKILAFAGSLRSDSFNKLMVRIAANGANQAGAETTYLDLQEYPLPVYDGDLEAAEGIPDNAQKLKDLFRDHHGLLIATPEYNSSISGGLKNVIDWVSRPEEGHPPLDCFSGKVAGIMAAAMGGMGGMRALPHLRSILQNIQVMVVPRMVGLPAAHEAFNGDGTLKDDKKRNSVEMIGADVSNLLTKLLG